MNFRQLVFALVIVPTLALAGERDYQCQVKQFFMLDDSGTLRPADRESVLVGEKFAVDRYTGRIIGGLLDNRSARQITVLDRGSGTNSFQLLTIDRSDQHELLVIKEYTKEELKPFVSVSIFVVRTGICR